MSADKLKVRALQAEKGQMRYVFGAIVCRVTITRLIGPFQIVVSRVVDGALGTTKFASIKSGRSLDLGPATVES